jgi:HK97 family phage portal protein
MAWYNNIFGQKVIEVEEKLNPAQFHMGGNITPSHEPSFSYEKAYEDLEIVNRGVNMIVDDVAEIHTLVSRENSFRGVIPGIKASKVEVLLNKSPNPYQDINSFKRNLISDFLIDGNIFMYFDGAHLYHLPATDVTIHSSKETYIEKFTMHDITFSPDEIIHIKENSFHSIYRGVPRLSPAARTMNLMSSMRKFQDNFFKNGAVPGLVLKSPNTLSDKIKDRMILAWQQRYRPDAGGRRPLILDGGIEVDAISNVSFKDLDFQNAIAENEKIILKALGVPPILLDSGNNANIRPNLRLYYLETILPIVRKINFAMTRFYGFECVEDITEIPALQPELRDASAYYTSLVNGGIITAAEARERLGFPEIENTQEIRVPANIAGSAANPDEGGRPVEETEDE